MLDPGAKALVSEKQLGITRVNESFTVNKRQHIPVSRTERNTATVSSRYGQTDKNKKAVLLQLNRVMPSVSLSANRQSRLIL